jgi:hypothetical protein
MLTIDLAIIDAIEEGKASAFGQAQFRVFFRGSMITLDKTRGQPLLAEWKTYGTQYPTHKPTVLVTL